MENISNSPDQLPEVLTFQHFEQCLKEVEKENYEPKISEIEVNGNKYIKAATKDVASKLPEILVKVTRTPGFKKWFGDWINQPQNSSKATDLETDEPLFVHHGVEYPTHPDIGPTLRNYSKDEPHLSSILYTTTKSKDAEYWSKFASANGQKFDPQVYGAFLNIRNPVHVDSQDELIIKMKNEKNIRKSNDGVIQRTGPIQPAIDPTDQFAVFDNKKNIMWIPIVKIS